MKTQWQKTGKLGEDLAVKYLKKKCYKIIERNFRPGKYGEIDIITNDKEEIVFVEVKTKTGEQFGSPEEEFNYQKRKKMRRAIQNYLFKNYSQDKQWRVDLIAIEILGGKAEIRHYENISL